MWRAKIFLLAVALYVTFDSYTVGQQLTINVQGGPKNRTCLSIDNSAMVTHRKACDMSKVFECCKQKETNLHNKSFKYSLPNLHKSLLPLKLGM